MHSSLVAGFFLLLVLSSSLAGCSKTCTGENCTSQAVVRIRRADGRAPTFAVEVEIANERSNCDAPVEGGRTRTCGTRVSVALGQQTRCQDTSEAGPNVATCAATGQYDEVIEIDGNPPNFTIRLKDGDAVIAERTFQPRYVASEPNGPGCGLCTRSEELWTLP